MNRLFSYSGFICTRFEKFTNIDWLAEQTGCKNPYPFIYEGMAGEISLDQGITWKKITMPSNLIIDNIEDLFLEDRGFGIGLINFVDWFNSIVEFENNNVKYFPRDNLGYILDCPKNIRFWFNFIEKYGCPEIEDFKYGLSASGDCWEYWENHP
jgi:hypothetical protein